MGLNKINISVSSQEAGEVIRAVKSAIHPDEWTDAEVNIEIKQQVQQNVSGVNERIEKLEEEVYSTNNLHFDKLESDIRKLQARINELVG